MLLSWHNKGGVQTLEKLTPRLSDSPYELGKGIHMQTVAFYATLFNQNVGTTGIAMRTTEGRVFFQTEATGLWRELFDADATNLHLHGRCDISLSQAIVDGQLVVKASRTLQRAA